MSGVATATRAWADALAGTGTRVRDSRKTVPGLRMLQKYAVRVGGGVNHRMSLADAALIKDNHVIAAGGVVPAYRAVRAAFPDLAVQVEVTTRRAGPARSSPPGPDDILLDNMDPAEMAAIVAEHSGADVRIRSQRRTYVLRTPPRWQRPAWTLLRSAQLPIRRRSSILRWIWLT